MSSPAPLADLLDAVSARGIELWCEGDRLRFHAPKGALQADERALLSSQRAGLMAALRARGAARSEELALSYPQFAMWFQHQRAPSSSVCTVGFVLKASGPLDVGALRHAAQGLVDRHAVLRTTYHVRDETLIQRIAGTAQALLEVQPQPQGASAATAADALAADIAAQIARPFDLETGPLFRVVLFTDGASEHTVLVTYHHIAADGWSSRIILSELLSLYGQAAEKRPPELTRPAATYGEFVRWQTAAVNGAGGERQWSYWRSLLAAPRARTVLPTEVGRPAVPRFVGASVSSDLSAARVSRVQGLAAALRTTPFVVLFGAFQLLLARLCGVRDVVTGMPALGRPKAEFSSVVGNFMNVLPVRSRLEGSATVGEFLAQLHATVVSALEAQDYPLLRMVQQLHLSGEETGQALFNTSFTVLTRDLDEAAAGRTVAGTVFALQPLAWQAGLLDLGMDILASDAGMQCVVKYSLDVLTAPGAAVVARQYAAMIDAITDAPDQALSALLGASISAASDDARAANILSALAARDISLVLDGDRLRVNAPKGALDEATRRSIAAERSAIIARLRTFAADSGAGAKVHHDRSRCVHHLLEQSARLHPERVAVSGAGGELRYDVLDARANQLAHFLLRNDLPRGAAVAVCLERTVNIPVALAAVLKAGGAYVPLDPAHPRERLREILRDAGASLLITQNGFEDIAGGTEARAIRLDADADAGAIAACANTSPRVPVDPRDLAYVIYTSGSTGQAKGVEVEHRNVVAFLEAMRRQPGLGAADVLLAVTTIGFDIAGLELWLPLAVGARIVLGTRAEAVDGARLAALLDAQSVSVMQATPATWRLLLESGWAGRPSLRALCGGEALPPALATRLLGRVGELWNLYGPTETTIWSTAARLDAALLAQSPATVTIGRPIANTVVHLEDPYGRAVPTGGVGELVIGGEGVARGYRDRPEQTARAFVTREAGGEISRLYRTGDLARFRADGQLDFLGRRDHQIKLRGHRIEPGEIEAMLMSHSGVSGCVVIAHPARPDDERLVAYLTLSAGATLDADGLRAALRARLPEYMVPGHFVVLAALPLTPNGKVDRAALPAPGTGDASADAPAALPLSAVPMTSAQHRVAVLWQEVLRVGRVGLNDNFFDLGGHSLLLVKIHAGLKREFGCDLPLVELFQHTTVAQQARALERSSHA